MTRPSPQRRPTSPSVVALVSVALGLVLVAACRNAGVVTASYATLAEARAAGAVSQKHLPEGLPPGTYEIRTAHDPGTPRRWALFSFPPAEAERLRTLVDPQEVPLAGVTCDVPGRIEWWPVILRDRLSPERIAETGLRTYRLRGEASILAVNWSQGRAYLWTETGR